MEVYIKGLKTNDPTATFKVVYTGTDWTNGRPGMILVDVYKTKNGITTQLIITPHNQILNP